MSNPLRTSVPLAALSLAGCLALAGCDRGPTPKMSSTDAVLSQPVSTAQADTGTAMGQAVVDASAFDTMTRTEPTSAGVPDSRQTGAPEAPGTGPRLSHAERDFIAQTGEKSLFEIRVSELAAEKATDPALKAYAAMVAADHKGVTQEVKRLAAGQGLTLSESISPPDQKTLSALQHASGAAFDKQYLQTVGVTEHEKIIEVYERAGADAHHPAVKDHVQSTLPTLKSHLDAARRLQTGG